MAQRKKHSLQSIHLLESLVSIIRTQKCRPNENRDHISTEDETTSLFQGNHLKPSHFSSNLVTPTTMLVRPHHVLRNKSCDFIVAHKLELSNFTFIRINIWFILWSVEETLQVHFQYKRRRKVWVSGPTQHTTCSAQSISTLHTILACLHTLARFFFDPSVFTLQWWCMIKWGSWWSFVATITWHFPSMPR